MKIPTKPRRQWGSQPNELRQQELAAEREFEAHAETVLDALHPEWRKYICFKFDDDLAIKRGTNKWRGIALAKFKRLTEFQINAKQSANIRAYIDNEIAVKQAANKAQNAFDAMKSLLAPVFEKYTSETVEIKLDNIGLIRIFSGTTDERGRFGRKGEIRIGSRIGINKPHATFSRRIETLHEAYVFIGEFQSIHDELLRLAEAIKNDLPQEFFEQPVGDSSAIPF